MKNVKIQKGKLHGTCIDKSMGQNGSLEINLYIYWKLVQNKGIFSYQREKDGLSNKWCWDS